MTTPSRSLVRCQPADSSHPAALLGLVSLLVLTGAALVALVGPPDPNKLPAPPSWSTIEVLVRSQNVPLDGVLQVASLLAWLVWAWAVASLVVELALAVIEHGPARGAAWVRAARAVADRLSLPLARRAVAAALVVQVVARSASPAAAAPLGPSAALVVEARGADARAGAVPGVVTQFAPLAQAVDEASPSGDVVRHTVQPRETLWSIARRYYGSGEDFDRVIEANTGKVMADGRVFDRAGVIYPGWVLDIPLPSSALEREPDGSLVYVVQKGDTMRGISARVLGDEERYVEIFDLNVGVARVNGSGPVLRDPNLIWPDLRLHIPSDDPTAEPPSTPEPAPEPSPPPAAPQEAPSPPPAPAATQAATPVPTLAASETPTTPQAPAPAEPLPVTPEPAPLPRTGAQQQPPALLRAGIVAGGVLGAAGLAGAGALVVRRRRRAPLPSEPESDVVLADGFAEADPSQRLAQRLAGRGIDPAAQIAVRMSRAYAAILSTALARPEQTELFGQVSLVSMRHGRSSTTLMLSAPMAARAHLIRHLPAAAARAFGDSVDVEGLVSHEGDVLVRLTGVRQAVRGRLLEVGGGASEPGHEVWPAPALVPLGLLADRQTMLANWDGLTHVLVAAPLGQGADDVLVALLASLAAERPPSDLGLVTIAGPRTLPEELAVLPHQLVPLVDPQQPHDVLEALEQVRAELGRRAVAGVSGEPDLVLVVRELADLGPEALGVLGAILADGPRHRVRMLAASERPGAELAQACPVLGELATRLVLHAADEDESVALLGMPGAEELGAGGQLLLRLEGRLPIQAHGFRVAPDHLARLVTLMDQRPTFAASGSSVPTPADAPGEPTPERDFEEHEAEVEVDPSGAAEPPATAGAPGPEHIAENGHSVEPVPDAVLDLRRAHEDGEPSGEEDVTDGPETGVEALAEPVEHAAPTTDNHSGAGHCLASPLLRKLRAAPLRIRCLGTRQVWYHDQLVWPSPDAVEETGWELLLVLALHGVEGVQSEALAEILWPDKPPVNPGDSLRKRRWRLRKELKRLVPPLDADPLPTDPDGGVYRLDPSVVASDVQWFVELATCAKALPREQAIAAYEEALELYRGDLLDGLDVPNLWWLYSGPKLAMTLRPDYRRIEEEVRLHLAELRAAGTSEEDLLRAQELYAGLTAERLDDERLWAALFRVCGRLGDQLSLDLSERRLRTALVELGVGQDADTVPLPPSLERVLQEMRAALDGHPRTPAP